MAVTYASSVAALDATALADGFFEGWSAPPSPAQHLAMLRGSTHVALALVDAKVIGFANALSDGVMAAYVPLLEVLPRYRNQGIGSELVRLLLADLRSMYMVDVVCDENLLPFYARLGFQSASAAVIRNREWSSER